MKRSSKITPTSPAAKATEAPKPQSPLSNLTATQQRIAELLSDALINGAHPDDISSMVRAALRHEHRRRAPWWNEQNEGGKGPGSFAKDRTPEIVRVLAQCWPPAPPVADAPKPTTISEAIARCSAQIIKTSGLSSASLAVRYTRRTVSARESPNS